MFGFGFWQYISYGAMHASKRVRADRRKSIFLSNFPAKYTTNPPIPQTILFVPWGGGNILSKSYLEGCEEGGKVKFLGGGVLRYVHAGGL